VSVVPSSSFSALLAAAASLPLHLLDLTLQDYPGIPRPFGRGLPSVYPLCSHLNCISAPVGRGNLSPSDAATSFGGSACWGIEELQRSELKSPHRWFAIDQRPHTLKRNARGAEVIKICGTFCGDVSERIQNGTPSAGLTPMCPTRPASDSRCPPRCFKCSVPPPRNVGKVWPKRLR
jgi:hypothetical protein